MINARRKKKERKEKKKKVYRGKEWNQTKKEETTKIDEGRKKIYIYNLK